MFSARSDLSNFQTCSLSGPHLCIPAPRNELQHVEDDVEGPEAVAGQFDLEQSEAEPLAFVFRSRNLIQPEPELEGDLSNVKERVE